ARRAPARARLRSHRRTSGHPRPSLVMIAEAGTKCSAMVAGSSATVGWGGTTWWLAGASRCSKTRIVGSRQVHSACSAPVGGSSSPGEYDTHGTYLRPNRSTPAFSADSYWNAHRLPKMRIIRSRAASGEVAVTVG